MKNLIKFNLWLVALMLPFAVFSAMSSTNYYIYADSVETGGGYSTDIGGVYSLEDTLGEGIISQSTSTAYTINAGYQAMVLGSLSMNIANHSINLGDLSTTNINTANTTITISTDAVTGYSMSVETTSWTGIALNTINIGEEVTAGQEGYGLALTGDDAVTTTDRGITNNLILASNLGPVNGKQTTLIFKATISSSTAVGSRSNNVNIGVSANF